MEPQKKRERGGGNETKIHGKECRYIVGKMAADEATNQKRKKKKRKEKRKRKWCHKIAADKDYFMTPPLPPPHRGWMT
jgi:hypothetical protein